MEKPGAIIVFHDTDEIPGRDDADERAEERAHGPHPHPLGIFPAIVSADAKTRSQ